MPADGRRKKILTATVTTIRTATGADFFFNYSGTEVVNLGKDVLESRLEGSKPVVVRVWDGTETHKRDISNGFAKLDVIVEATVKDSAQHLVERVADVMADLNLIIGRNSLLGGTCTSSSLGSVEAPFYDFERQYAVARIHLATEYEYVPGVDR